MLAETLEHAQLQSKVSHTHYRIKTVWWFCEEERKNNYEKTLRRKREFYLSTIGP
jgi:hypothetical protein